VRYDIIIKGFILSPPQPPFKGLMATFGIDAPTAKRILSKFPCVVKRGVELEEAERFEVALTAIGARVEVRPEEVVPSSVVAQPIAVLQAPLILRSVPVAVQQAPVAVQPAPEAVQPVLVAEQQAKRSLQQAPPLSSSYAERPRSDEILRSARATEQMVPPVTNYADPPKTQPRAVLPTALQFQARPQPAIEETKAQAQATPLQAQAAPVQAPVSPRANDLAVAQPQAPSPPQPREAPPVQVRVQAQAQVHAHAHAAAEAAWELLPADVSRIQAEPASTPVQPALEEAAAVSDFGPLPDLDALPIQAPAPRPRFKTARDFAATMLQLPDEVSAQLRFLAPAPRSDEGPLSHAAQGGLLDARAHVPFDAPLDDELSPVSPGPDDDLAELWAPLDLPPATDIALPKAGPPDLTAFDPENFNLDLALDTEPLLDLGRSVFEPVKARGSHVALSGLELAMERMTPTPAVTAAGERESARELSSARGAQKWLIRPGVTPPVPDQDLPSELHLHLPPYGLLAYVAAPIVMMLVVGLTASWIAALLIGTCVGLGVGWWLPANRTAEGLRWLCNQSMYFSRTELDSPFDLEFVRNYERWAKHHGFELSRVMDLSRTGTTRSLAVFRHAELPLFLLLHLGGSRVQCDLWSVFERGIVLMTTDRPRERPVPTRHYVQNYPRAGLRTLWQRHLQTHDALTERLQLKPLSALDFEPIFREACKEELELLDTIPMWPLRVPLWQRSLSQKYNGVGVAEQRPDEG